MANIQEYLRKLADGTVSLEEQQVALQQIESTLIETRKKREEAVNNSAEKVVSALKQIEDRLNDKYEELLNTPAMKGEAGPQGPAGKDGKDGRNGVDGRDGKDGIDGKDGVDGKDGISVVDATVDFDGSLVITLSDGNQIDAGQLFSPETAQTIQIIKGGAGGTALPSQAGNAGKYLTTDGTALSWDAVAGGSGTVTSITAGSGLSGGTITSSGTIALDINSLSPTTVAPTDLVPVYDVSATANADCTASDIAGLGVGSIGYKTNNYYFGYLMNGLGTTTSLTANRIYYIPFYVRKKTTFTRIGFVISATAGLIARFGIYNAANGVPTSLVLDCGTVSTTTTGEKEATISVTLNTGFYFLSVIPDSTPTVAISSFVSQISGYAVGQSTRTTQFYAYVAANGSTTLPDPAQTSLLELQSGLPGISLRVV
jgi:hypothetical protein